LRSCRNGQCRGLRPWQGCRQSARRYTDGVMCGRYELHTHPAAIQLAMGLPFPPEVSARYNIAPTQQVPIVRLRDGKRELSQVRWGLVPFWAKDVAIGSKMINARAETVATAPAFRSAFKRTRCLIPASGFYEWQKREGTTKLPMHIGMKDDSTFAFAGLWTSWGPKDGERGRSARHRRPLERQCLLRLHSRYRS